MWINNVMPVSEIETPRIDVFAWKYLDLDFLR